MQPFTVSRIALERLVPCLAGKYEARKILQGLRFAAGGRFVATDGKVLGMHRDAHTASEVVTIHADWKKLLAQKPTAEKRAPLRSRGIELGHFRITPDGLGFTIQPLMSTHGREPEPFGTAIASEVHDFGVYPPWEQIMPTGEPIARDGLCIDPEAFRRLPKTRGFQTFVRPFERVCLVTYTDRENADEFFYLLPYGIIRQSAQGLLPDWAGV